MSAVTAASSTRALIARQMRARRITDQIGRILLTVILVLTAAVYLSVPFLALSWLQGPFPGVFVEYPNHVNGTRSAVGEIWTGFEAGLQVGDEILAIDGEVVNTPREVYRLTRAMQPNDEAVFEVRGEDGAERQI